MGSGASVASKEAWETLVSQLPWQSRGDDADPGDGVYNVDTPSLRRRDPQPPFSALLFPRHEWHVLRIFASKFRIRQRDLLRLYAAFLTSPSLEKHNSSRLLDSLLPTSSNNSKLRRKRFKSPVKQKLHSYDPTKDSLAAMTAVSICKAQEQGKKFVTLVKYISHPPAQEEQQSPAASMIPKEEVPQVSLQRIRSRFSHLPIITQELADLFIPALFMRAMAGLESNENGEHISFARLAVMSGILGGQSHTDWIHDFLAVLRRRLDLRASEIVSATSMAAVIEVLMDVFPLDTGCARVLKLAFKQRATAATEAAAVAAKPVAPTRHRGGIAAANAAAEALRIAAKAKEWRAGELAGVGRRYPATFFALAEFRRLFRHVFYGELFWRGRRLDARGRVKQTTTLPPGEKPKGTVLSTIDEDRSDPDDLMSWGPHAGSSEAESVETSVLSRTSVLRVTARALIRDALRAEKPLSTYNLSVVYDPPDATDLLHADTSFNETGALFPFDDFDPSKELNISTSKNSEDLSAFAKWHQSGANSLLVGLRAIENGAGTLRPAQLKRLVASYGYDTTRKLLGEAQFQCAPQIPFIASFFAHSDLLSATAQAIDMASRRAQTMPAMRMSRLHTSKKYSVSGNVSGKTIRGSGMSRRSAKSFISATAHHSLQAASFLTRGGSEDDNNTVEAAPSANAILRAIAEARRLVELGDIPSNQPTETNVNNNALRYQSLTEDAEAALLPTAEVLYDPDTGYEFIYDVASGLSEWLPQYVTEHGAPWHPPLSSDDLRQIQVLSDEDRWEEQRLASLKS